MNRRGFTLIEVLVALALLALLSGLMAQFGLGLADRRVKLSRIGSQQQGVTALFQQVDRALTGADAQGAGVQVTDSQLRVTTRRIVSKPVLEELDLFSLTFDRETNTLESSWKSQDGESDTPEILSARFRAFDGQQWGAFQADSLPQAIEVAIWFKASQRDQIPASASVQDPGASPERAPDRWRIFSLIDTLPEIES